MSSDRPCPTSKTGLCAALALASLTLSTGPARADLASALGALGRLGSEGQGNEPAKAAWVEIASAPADDLPKLLEAMDGAGALARNYLFSAATAIADRALAEGKPLPVTRLGDFLMDTGHAPKSRRLAYELLARADAAVAEAMLPGFLDDPASELRRDAVQRLMDQATRILGEGRTNAAGVVYRQALGFARDGDQIEALVKPLKEMGRPVDLVGQLGFLMRWHVVGPFDNTGLAGFDTAYPPEAGVKLDATYDGKDGKVAWKEFTGTHEFGMVDFNKAIGMLKEVTGYAYAEFESDADRPAEVRLGCKNGWKVWLNGRYLFGRDEYHRGAEMDQYRMPVDLKAGRNTLLVKLTQNEQKEEWTVEWEFQLRITDPTGRVIRPVARR